MKTTVRIPKSESKKLYVSSRINKVKLGEVAPFGTDEVMIELDYKEGSDLIAVGRMLDKVTGNEFDAADAKAAAAKADREKAQAAAAGKKK